MIDKKPTPTGTKKAEPVELEKFRKTRELRDLLALPGMEDCRRTYAAGDPVPCNPHTMIVTLTGSIMVYRKTHTGHGTKRTELRSYGPHRLPNFGALRGTGYSSEHFAMMAEGKPGDVVQALEFDFRIHGDLLRACRDWFQELFLDQHGEDLGQITYWQDRDAREWTDNEVELARKLADANAKIVLLEDSIQQQGEKFIDTLNKLDMTSANLANTTSLLEKAGAANEALRRMTPDVLSMIEESDAKMRREAEKFPLVVNALLEARGAPPMSWEEIGPILKRLEEKRLEESRVEIEEEEVEVDASSLRAPSLAPPAPDPTDPDLVGRTTAAWPVARDSTPDSQVAVSSGRRLGGEKIETRTGIADADPIPLSSHAPCPPKDEPIRRTKAYEVSRYLPKPKK